MVQQAIGSGESARKGLNLMGWGALVAALVLLASCAGPRPRAPVTHRDSPAVQPSAVTAAPPVVVVPPAPAPRPAPVAPPVNAAEAAAAAPVSKVETAPVRSGNIEARTLPPAALGASVKTEPNAMKQPYSDSLLAKMQASQTPLVPASPAEPAPVTAAKAPAAPAAKSDPRATADLPAGGFHWPSSGRIIETFSEPRSNGLVFDGKPGDPVLAAADGKVIFSGVGPRGYGNLIIIKHEGDLLSVYAHNRALLVKEGQQVKRDQRVAELGDSGTDKPKLHFEIRRQGRPIDPLALLPPR